jgi:hypothetical protein
VTAVPIAYAAGLGWAPGNRTRTVPIRSPDLCKRRIGVNHSACQPSDAPRVVGLAEHDIAVSLACQLDHVIDERRNADARGQFAFDLHG